MRRLGCSAACYGALYYAPGLNPTIRSKNQRKKWIGLELSRHSDTLEELACVGIHSPYLLSEASGIVCAAKNTCCVT